jgi:hypothetical protein
MCTSKRFLTKFFLARLRAFIATHFSKQPKSLVAISQVNSGLSAGLPAKIPSAFGPIEIKPSLSKTDKAVITKLEPYERSRLGLHDDFLYLSCKVATTDDRSAIDTAYRNIKYALGVLNLITRGYSVGKRFGYPNAPIGKFLSASTIFTIDRRERKMGAYLSENHYPTFWKQNFSVWQRTDAEEITKFAKYYVSDLARIDFRDKLVQAVVLFQEGQEATHIDVALLKFWTGIEVLCGPGREGTHRADG